MTETTTTYLLGQDEPYFVLHERALIGFDTDGKAFYGPRLDASRRSSIYFETLRDTSEAEVERGKQALRNAIEAAA